MTKSVEDRVTERNQKTFGPDFDFTVPTGFPAIRFYRNLFSPIHRRLHFQKWLESSSMKFPRGEKSLKLTSFSSIRNFFEDSIL